MKQNSDFQNTSINMPTRKNSRLAIVALICAITAVMLTLLDAFVCTSFRCEGRLFAVSVFLLGPLAFILGIAAVAVIAFNRKRFKGNWYAALAIFISLPFILAMASAIIVNRTRVEGNKTSNGRFISMAIIKYAQDHNGYLPDANQWCDLLIEHDKKLSKDDFKYESSEYDICNYAFNGNLSGARLDNMSYNTVLIFESEGKWNLSGTEELFRKTPKKRRYVYVYTKDAETGYNLPCAVNAKDIDYEVVLWKLSYTKE